MVYYWRGSQTLMANEHPTEAAPSLEDVVRAYSEAVVEKRGGPQLAKVETYDGRHTATVRPLTPVPVNGQFLPAPVFTVAVGWPSDGGPAPRFAATFPIKPGSIMELLPHKYDQSTYLESGAIDQPPTSERRMDLTDAIARPTAAAAGVPLPANAFAADGYVILAAPFIYLGGADATDFIALASKIAAEFSKIAAQLNHVHLAPAAVTGLPRPPPTGLPTFTPYSPSSVASAVVKSK